MVNPKITEENRERFYAQYWGQSIQIFRGHLFNNVNPENKDPVQLKPLSSISDEDAIEVGFSDREDPESADYHMSPSECFLDFYETYGYHLFGATKIDLLRSRGYALPWNGITVEQQIEAGWVKLVEQ